MYVTGISSGSARNRSIETSSKTSSASGTPTIRRFDVLLNEQVSLVANAQDGLKQSLELYEKASSKEEQESARLQVQSLLSRAEELVLSLQVVIHVRRELTHTQLYAMDLRQKGKDTTEVLKRLTWLENRLEKLLFARRRGRPAARGRRAQISRRYMTEHCSQMDNHHPPSTPMDQVSTTLPSVAADETDDSDSDLCSSSDSSDANNEHDVKQGSRQSYYSTDTSLQNTADDDIRRAKNSSKQVSLSVIETDPFNIATSQELGVPDSRDPTSPPLPTYMLNFERPKSGCDRHSWNALPLAIHSSFLSKREQDPNSAEDSKSESSVMDVLIEKIEMFASYIETAARTFTTPGHCLPVLRKLSPEKKQVSSSRMKQSAKICNEMSAKHTVTKLPPLELSSIDWPAINWSHRKYGKESNDIYPKDFNKWCGPKLSSQSFSSKQQKGSARLPSQLRPRNSSSKSKSRDSGRRFTNKEYFEPEKHRHRLVQDLLQSLKSPIDDVRKDSAQELGKLGAGRTEVIMPLKDLMANDSNYLVQYEAAKSLITLGEWTKSLVDFITYTIANGPSVIQLDLLELLATVENLSQIEEFEDSYCRCVQFTSEIVRVNAVNGLSLLAAVVVSNMNHHYIHCQGAIINRLKDGLADDKARNRSKALNSLALKWNIKETYIVEEAIEQLCKMFEWTLRLEAIKVLLHIGKDGLLQLGEAHVFKILVTKLSDDPIQRLEGSSVVLQKVRRQGKRFLTRAVRFNVGKLINAIGLRIKALDLLLKQLNDHNDNVRTRAVMAMGNFDLKGTKYMQGLLDLLELDANKNVRIQVLRVFGNIKFYEARVIEKLLERDKGSGVIAKEAQKALKNLEKEKVIRGYSKWSR